jgi:hypothetical protein
VVLKKSLFANHQISRKMMEKNNKERITNALQEIESNCGQVGDPMTK